MSTVAVLCTFVILMTFGVYTASMNATARLACMQQMNSTQRSENATSEPGGNVAFMCYHVYKSPMLVNSSIPYMAVFKGCFNIHAYLNCTPPPCTNEYLPKTFNKMVTCCPSYMDENCDKNIFYKNYAIEEESVPTGVITTHNIHMSTRGEGRQPGTPSRFDPKTATGVTETSASGGGLETSGRFCLYLLVMGAIIVVAFAVRDFLRWKLNKYCIYNVSVRHASKRDCPVCQAEEKPYRTTQGHQGDYEETKI